MAFLLLFVGGNNKMKKVCFLLFLFSSTHGYHTITPGSASVAVISRFSFDAASIDFTMVTTCEEEVEDRPSYSAGADTYTEPVDTVGGSPA